MNDIQRRLAALEAAATATARQWVLVEFVIATGEYQTPDASHERIEDIDAYRQSFGVHARLVVIER